MEVVGIEPVVADRWMPPSFPSKGVVPPDPVPVLVVIVAGVVGIIGDDAVWPVATGAVGGRVVVVEFLVNGGEGGMYATGCSASRWCIPWSIDDTGVSEKKRCMGPGAPGRFLKLSERPITRGARGGLDGTECGILGGGRGGVREGADGWASAVMGTDVVKGPGGVGGAGEYCEGAGGESGPKSCSRGAVSEAGSGFGGGGDGEGEGDPNAPGTAEVGEVLMLVQQCTVARR